MSAILDLRKYKHKKVSDKLIKTKLTSMLEWVWWKLNPIWKSNKLWKWVDEMSFLMEGWHLNEKVNAEKMSWLKYYSKIATKSKVDIKYKFDIR